MERQDICLDLTSIRNHFSESVVIDDAQVPHGYYVECNMTTTMICNSSVLMLSVACEKVVSLKIGFGSLYDRAVYVG